MADCLPVQILSAAFLTLSVASSGLLFLLRVRAVYLQSSRITLVFGTLWFITVSLGIFADTTMHPSQSWQCYTYARLLNMYPFSTPSRYLQMFWPGQQLCRNANYICFCIWYLDHCHHIIPFGGRYFYRKKLALLSVFTSLRDRSIQPFQITYEKRAALLPVSTH